LSEEALGFSFFDSNVLVDLKNKMTKALISNDGLDKID